MTLMIAMRLPARGATGDAYKALALVIVISHDFVGATITFSSLNQREADDEKRRTSAQCRERGFICHKKPATLFHIVLNNGLSPGSIQLLFGALHCSRPLLAIS